MLFTYSLSTEGITYSAFHNSQVAFKTGHKVGPLSTERLLTFYILLLNLLSLQSAKEFWVTSPSQNWEICPMVSILESSVMNESWILYNWVLASIACGHCSFSKKHLQILERIVLIIILSFKRDYVMVRLFSSSIMFQNFCNSIHSIFEHCFAEHCVHQCFFLFFIIRTCCCRTIFWRTDQSRSTVKLNAVSIKVCIPE